MIARNQIKPDDAPVARAIGFRRLDISRFLHLHEDGPVGLDLPGEDAQGNRGTQDNPDAAAEKGADHGSGSGRKGGPGHLSNAG